MVKKRVTLSLDKDIWKLYKSKCIMREIVPSHEIERYMKEMLREWGDEDG